MFQGNRKVLSPMRELAWQPTGHLPPAVSFQRWGSLSSESLGLTCGDLTQSA